jgi:hypothetical protein
MNRVRVCIRNLAGLRRRISREAVDPSRDRLPGAKMSRTKFLVGMLLVFTLQIFGCSRPAASPWDTSHWTAKPVAGLVVVGEDPMRPDCTGSVIASAPQPTLVVTARHCVVDDYGNARATSFTVNLPEVTANGVRWRAMVAKIALTVPLATPKAQADDDASNGGTRWDDSDWAFLTIDGNERLATVPLFPGDPATEIPRGDSVELASFFDDNESALFPHVHRFAWGDHPRELAQGGHSGAPILWHGQLIAAFSGARADWFLFFRRYSWLRHVNLVSVVRIRDALGGTRTPTR